MINFKEPEIYFYACAKHEHILRELGRRNNLIPSGPCDFSPAICEFYDCKEIANFLIRVRVITK